MIDIPPLAELAAQLLRGDHALSQITPADARRAVDYMELRRFQEGQLLIREGEASAEGSMLLILDGEVTVENAIASRGAPLVVSVLGPGHIIGETGVLDGGPRTASCTATTPVMAGELTSEALSSMVDEAPDVAARLLMNLSQRMALRLRETGRQVKVFQQLLDAMEGEVGELQRQLQLVMAGAANRKTLPKKL